MSGVNREYKDRLFVAIFGRRENQKWTLSLYNAVNGTSYEDPSEIEINTMDDSVYMGMKNDVSFILRDHISIYEQQSTYNPNEMPRDYEIRKFLEGNREEVRMDLITEYDAEEHMRLVRRDAREEEREDCIRIFIEDKVEDGFPDAQIRERLKKRFLLSEDQIEEYMKKYAGSMVTS